MIVKKCFYPFFYWLFVCLCVCFFNVQPTYSASVSRECNDIFISVRSIVNSTKNENQQLQIKEYCKRNDKTHWLQANFHHTSRISLCLRASKSSFYISLKLEHIYGAGTHATGTLFIYSLVPSPITYSFFFLPITNLYVYPVT